MVGVVDVNVSAEWGLVPAQFRCEVIAAALGLQIHSVC
jgi:hypothetical protein